MSPRAAWRLETLGFRDVRVYAAGKSDWGAFGLPVEGEVTRVPRIASVLRADVPTCGLADTLEAVRMRLGEWKSCIVTNDERIVLGRLYQSDLGGAPGARAEDVMRPGPSTFRPNVSVHEMLEYMDRNDLDSALVTRSDGRLAGLALRADLERAHGGPARLSGKRARRRVSGR